MRFIQRTLLFLLLVFILFVMTQCYLLKQGSYILRYNSRAEKIQKLEREGTVDEKEQTLFSLVDEIRRYAVQKIGLKKNNNYTKYICVEKNHLVDVVSASRKDRFEPYLWKFPIFGSFPYKGYFEYEDAHKEAVRLRKMDYDVLVRKADAFSTLGFFSDPIYSYMADYSEYALASLIIHEQTHATIYLKNQVQFNEELATFIGREGALNFIRDRHGEGSSTYKKVIAFRRDVETYYRIMQELYSRLDALYNSGESRDEILQQKARILEEFQNSLREHYDDFFTTEEFKGITKVQINNAYLLSVHRYTGDLSQFYVLYDALGCDLRRMVEVVLPVKKYRGDPEDFITECIAAAHSGGIS
jgi:predicted aminopeptidase